MYKDNFIRIYGINSENHENMVEFLENVDYEFEQDCWFRELSNQSLVKGEIESIINRAKEFDIQLIINDSHTKNIIERIDSSEKIYNEIRNLDKNKIEDVKIDQKEFVRELKSYQKFSVNHLIKFPHSANFSIPGSGKTTIVLAAYSVLKKREDFEKVVVICPLGAFRAWEDEWKECYGRKAESYRINSESINSLDRMFGSSELILIGYKMAKNHRKKLQEQLKKYKILLIVDESHRIKKFPDDDDEWNASNASGILQLAPYAEKRLILTGTPMPRSLFDLWSQFTFLYCDREIFGTDTEYSARIPSKYEDSENKEQLIKDIAERIENLYVRITKDQLGLPKAENQIHYVDMKPIQRRIWNAIKEIEFYPNESMETSAQVLREYRTPPSVRLLQISSNPGILTKEGEIHGKFKIPPYEHDDLNIQQLIKNYSTLEVPEKFEKIQKLVKKILKKDGEKVIIWSNYIYNIEILKEQFLSEFDPIIIHSQTDQFEEDEHWNQENEEKIEQFKNNPEKRVLITTTQSCGEAISLHKICTNAIYFDRNFNAGLYMQSKDRIHRIGSDKQVTYHIFITRDSLDQSLHDILEEREENMRILLNESDMVGILKNKTDTDEEEIQTRVMAALLKKR